MWSVVGGAETTPSTNEEEKKRWKIKVGKAMYMLLVIMEDRFLQQIKDLSTLKEARDTLVTLFTRKNDAKVQLLENELMQEDMSVSQYFTKVRSICNEITKLDSESVISEVKK